MEIENLLAKSLDKGGMKLVEHLELCADNCYKQFKMVSNNERYAQLSFLAGLLHDVGKAIETFQTLLDGKKFGEEIYRHNVVSAYLIANYVDITSNDKFEFSLSNQYKNLIIRSILYHHPINMIDSESIRDEFPYNIEDLKLTSEEIKCIHSLLNVCVKYYISYFNTNMLYTVKCIDKRPEGEYGYSTIYFRDDCSVDSVKNRESYFWMISNTLRAADICASDCNYNINNFVYNSLRGEEAIFNKPDGYDGRFYEQKQIAEKLSKQNFSILEAMTGFGKTLTGVMYLLSNNKKGYWVCPRNCIAEGIYRSVTNEVNALGLGDKISVALLLTNEFKHGDKYSDIIVTNIDNFVRPILKTDVNYALAGFMTNNVIFDEFHEYIDDCLAGMFCSVIAMRSRLINTNTLLMSATIPPFGRDKFPYKYCTIREDNFLFINRNQIQNSDISKKKYQVFVDSDVNVCTKGQNTMVNLNTVLSVQKLYIAGNTDKIIHSRYVDSDLFDIKKELYVTHSKNAIKESENVYNNTSYASTNMISTGVDVSFSNLIYNYVQPDRMIQLVGRINRFNECTTEVPKLFLNNSDFNEKSERKGINVTYDSRLSNLFYAFVKGKIQNGEIVTLERLCDIRDEFYDTYYDKKEEKNVFKRNNKQIISISEYFDEVVKASFRHLSHLSYAKKYMSKNDDTDDIVYISNNVSLRNIKNTKKDMETYSFWGIFKDKNKNAMTEPINVDTIIIPNMADDDMIDSAISYIESKGDAEIEKYFGKRWKYRKGHKNRIDLINMFTKLSICNKTPFPVVSGYRYTKELGIFSEKIYGK